MKIKSKWIMLGGILLGIAILAGMIFQIQQIRFAQQHTEELKRSLKRYFEVTMTIDGWRDPNVMALVATDGHLENLIRFRCVTCTRIQAVTSIEILDIQIIEYSSDQSKVQFRREYGWHDVDPSTGMIIGPCFSQAAMHVFFLKRENETWKVSEIDAIDVGDAYQVDLAPEQQAKYCP